MVLTRLEPVRAIIGDIPGRWWVGFAMHASSNHLKDRRFSEAMLAELIDGEIRPINAQAAFGRGTPLVVGVPGAFTPVCHEQHVPALVRRADELRMQGYTMLACIVASDPFVTAAWAKIVDPEGKIRFFSDGNLDFARSLNLVVDERELFLGKRSERYMLAVRDGVITASRIEQHITDYICTKPEEFVVDA